MTKDFFEEYVSINGISQYFLHLPNTGNDVVIMLHGGPGLANSYTAYYIQPYADFCNVVFYDQRGAGKTQLKNNSAPDSLSLDVLLEDLRQTVEYVKQKYETSRIFLAGHSWGSMLGTQYIIKYPETVMGYIGYGQVVDGHRQDRMYYEHVKAAVIKAGDQEDMKMLEGVNENFPNDREKYFEEYNLLSTIGYSKYDFYANDVFEIYGNSPIWTPEDEADFESLNQKLYAEVLFDYDISNVKEYDVPIYYILGRHDTMTSSIIAAEYFETIHAPQKGLYWMENAGHLPDTDDPSVFWGIIKEIISRHNV